MVEFNIWGRPRATSSHSELAANEQGLTVEPRKIKPYALSQANEEEFRKIEKNIPPEFDYGGTAWVSDDLLAVHDIPDFDRAIRVHEFLYRNPDKREERSRRMVDALLYEAIMEMTWNREIARTYWYGVRWYGKEAWKDASNIPSGIACQCARRFHSLSEEERIKIKSMVDNDGHILFHEHQSSRYLLWLGAFTLSAAVIAALNAQRQRI
jgi:hypothetical protein